MRYSGAQPVGPALDRRVLLSLLVLPVGFATAIVAWPVIRPQLAAAAVTADRGDARLLALAGLLFAASPACCGLVWHAALGRAGARLGRVDACARYGVGALVNSFAPAHLGDAARTALLVEALPSGERRRIVGCFAVVQCARLPALAGLALAALFPAEIALPATMLPLAAAFAVLAPVARRLLALSLLSLVVRVGAVGSVLVALGVPSPLRAAFAVVAALKLAAWWRSRPRTSVSPARPRRWRCTRDGGFRLARYQIACCAADAAPVVIRVTGTTGAVVPRDQWLLVTGTYKRTGGALPELAATSVAEIPAPEDPYE